MPLARLPGSDKKWRGIFPGKYFGNLWQTFNINLGKSTGRLRLSDKFRIITDGDDAAAPGLPKKFIRTDADRTDRYWCLSASKMLNTAGTNPYTAYSADGLTASPTTDSVDMETHERYKVAITSSTDATPIVVTTSANHNLLNGDTIEIIGHLTNVAANGSYVVANKTATTFELTGSVGSGAGAGSAGNVFGLQRLIVSRSTDLSALNRNDPATWDATWWTVTLGQRPLLSSTFHPLARLQRLLAVGDKHRLHTIDKDDVVSNTRLQFQYGYEVRLIIASKDRYWIGLQNNFAGKAKIIEWDGTSLTYNNEYELIGNSPLTGWIIGNIPGFVDDLGYIYKFNGNAFVIVQQFPIVEEKLVFDFSETTNAGGIHPNGSAVYEKKAYMLVNAPLNSRRMRSGIWEFDTEKETLIHFMGIGQHKTIGTDIDYGQTPLVRQGALYLAPSTVTGVPVLNFLAGATIYKSYTSTQKSVILRAVENESTSSNRGRNRGYFITPYLPASEIDALWSVVWLKFRKFVNSANRIILKWRVAEPINDATEFDDSVLQATGTWVNTTSFTSVVPTGIVVGDEVEVMSGDNAGCLAKISALSATPDGSATITVTISEAVPTSSTGGALFRYDNWTTETEISSTSIGNKKVNFTASGIGEFVQLKVELRGFSMEIDEVIVPYKTNTKIET